MIKVLTQFLSRYDQGLVLGAWGLGLLLSLCTLFIGQEIRFWADHPEYLNTDPLLVCYHVVPWLALFGALSWGRVRLSTATAVRIEQRISEQLMQHVLEMFPPAENIINRFMLDVPTIANGITHQAAMGVRHVFFCLMGFIMMWVTSPILTLCTLLVVPFAVVPFVYQLSRLKQSQKIISSTQDGLSCFVKECLDNITTIQAFSQEGETAKKWHEMISRYGQFGKHYGRQRASVVWWIVTSVAMGVFGIIITGAQYVLLTTGDMMSFIFYAVLCVGALTAFHNVQRDLLALKVSAERVSNLLQTPLPLMVGKRHFSKASRGMLGCHHVRFAYPGHAGHDVLKDVTFSMVPGELAALVGPSGAGKSTLFSLMLRFYSPQEGALFIDGVDIQHVDVRALRQRIGYVEQDPVLFAGTVYDNVLYGKPQASRKEVYQAMEEAGLGGFLHQWPEGEHTRVDHIALSGGQKQCVALARALIRRPSIFLLDEPTNALDPQNEALIQEAFQRVSRHHTTLMIAHRLSSILQAQKIIVLDQGVVQAVGSHGELVSQSPLYRRFVSQQFPHASSSTSPII